MTCGRKRKRKVKRNLLRSILFSGILFLTACSGGGNSTVTPTNVIANSNAINSGSSKAETPNQTRSAANGDENKAAGKLTVRFLDVGQGDSTLVTFPDGKNLLVDGGNNQYANRVVQDLRDAGVKTLDYVVATHPDADHTGSLDVVVNTFDVKQVFAPKVTHNTQTYLDFLQAVKNKGLSITPAKAGVKLDVGKSVAAEVVGPVKGYGTVDMNDWSVVLHIVDGNISFLLTGDAAHPSENDMMAAGEPLASTVLKVGHHGSEHSTSQAFLNRVHPQYAVISVGKDNKYGHPTAEVLNRLSAQGVKVFRTDEQGTIIAVTDGKTITFNHEPAKIGSPGEPASSHQAVAQVVHAAPIMPKASVAATALKVSAKPTPNDDQLSSAPVHAGGGAGEFIASKNSPQIYHEVGCPGGGTRIKASNAIYFKSEQEAKDTGRRMCYSKNCTMN
jgi:competence protein ComEC